MHSNASTLKHIVIGMKGGTPKVITPNVLKSLNSQTYSYRHESGYTKSGYTKCTGIPEGADSELYI